MQLVPVTVTVDKTPMTFDPISNINGLVTWAAESSVPNVSLAPVVTQSLHRPSKTSRLSKSRVRGVFPAPMVDINGVTTDKKSHDDWIDITYGFSEKTGPVRKAMLKKAFAQILDDELISDVIVNNRPAY